MHNRRIHLAGLLALACAGGVARNARAQASAYPSRTVSIIVGTEPGGAPDVIARLLAEQLSQRLGRQVIVENKPGAAGTVGARQAAAAAPDGHTLFLGTVSTHGIAPSVYREPGYDPLNGFAPVGMVASVPLIVVVNANLGVDTLRDFVKRAGTKPGELNYSTPGIGGPQHLSTELFAARAGIKLTHIPYKGGAGAVQAVLSGEVAVYFSGMPPALAHIQSGKLKALAVTTERRSVAAPSVPTIAEAGFPGFEADNWHALFAPARTAPEVVSLLNKALEQILATPEVKERLLRIGAEAVSGSPASLRSKVEAENRKWSQVVRQIGLAPL